MLQTASRYVPQKRRLTFNRLHGVISQKIELFITTAVRTSGPTIIRQDYKFWKTIGRLFIKTGTSNNLSGVLFCLLRNSVVEAVITENPRPWYPV
jgi:hypothetical protein